MGFQAAHDKLKGALAKVQVDSDVTGLLPRYYPVTSSNSSLEVDEHDDLKAGSSGSSKWTVPQLFFTCSLLCFLLAAGTAAGLAWGYAMTPRRMQQCPSPGFDGQVLDEVPPGRQLSNTAVNNDEDDGSCFHEMMLVGGREHPFEEITGVKGHIMPKMFGKVREKTIWSYWYDPVDCPSSNNCKMPDLIKLCAEVIELNKGTFDFHIVYMDTVRNWVSMLELPLQWQHLQPVRQKEALMNSLLARYGGVALDLSTVLLRPLDTMWNEMLLHRATFSGYMYRVNGQLWGRPEASAPWFLMSRREGIFSTAVRNQVVNYCDAFRFPDLTLGDRTLTPVLGSINSSLPSCFEDQTVWDKGNCPEPVQPRLYGNDASLISPRTDRRLIIRDPRDGPHLPFAYLDAFGMGTWRVTDTSKLLGHPPVCGSPSECWQKVVLPRFHSGSLVSVKLFRKGGALSFRTREELLTDENSFFFNWLRLAGADHLPLREPTTTTTTPLTTLTTRPATTTFHAKTK